MKNHRIALGLALLALASGIVSAHSFQSGKLKIGHPWARETAVGQKDGGGFLAITNNGRIADRLVSASSTAAREMQLHNMTMEGGVMRMRQVTGGIAIPASSSVTLKPGGYHVMFIGLKKRLVKGTKIPATLTFQRAGKVNVQFAVQPITSTAAEETSHAGH